MMVRSERCVLFKIAPSSDMELLFPYLHDEAFDVGVEIGLPGKPIESAFFIESGFVSLLISVAGKRMEIGLVGREGMLGLPAVLGSPVADYHAVVREEVRAKRVQAETLRRLMGERRALGAVLLRYMQAGVAQLAHTAFANAQLTIAERLARWLLMAHDRIDGDTLRVTHATLSEALGVQRPGVTLALHQLEAEGAIRCTHRAITIGDRDRLAGRTLGAYGPAERAYGNLLGAGIAKSQAARPSSP